MKLHELRREYLQGGLRRKHLASDPIVQFELWMQQAMAADLPDPTAMVVATADHNGQPSQRIVLLKQVDQQGFVFFTNIHSRKAKSIAANNKVSLHFPWHMLERQVIVQGVAVLLERKVVETYFASRPPESRLAAWASAQSEVIPSRKHLLAQYEAAQGQYDSYDIPVPDFWGGYRIVPSEIEFWQGGEHRLHDRFRYRWVDERWGLDRLSP
jgi:pyridoxamine 5'-phosphate oxidase